MLREPKKLLDYRLSSDADTDLDGIYDYTVTEFGEAQAISYLEDIEAKCTQLIENPELGQARDQVKLGLRGLACNQHIIFYRIMSDHIRIVRLLHTKRDYKRYF